MEKNTKKPAPKPVRYRALTGVSYHGNHYQSGDIMNDVPVASVGWLLEQNCIEKVD